MDDLIMPLEKRQNRIALQQNAHIAQTARTNFSLWSLKPSFEE
jgi:hypothetical protein